MHKDRILIVEDEKSVSDLIRSTLEGWGYDIISVASTGEKAIELAEAGNVDLVLMDIILNSEMTGTYAAEIIKRTHNIPIIFLTSYLNEFMIEQAKLSQPYAYLLKPHNEKELYAAIEMALHNSRKEKTAYNHKLLLEMAYSINKLFINPGRQNEILKKICDTFVAGRLFSEAWVALINDAGVMHDFHSAGLNGRSNDMLSFFKDKTYAARMNMIAGTSGIAEIPESQLYPEEYGGASNNKLRKAVILRMSKDDRLCGFICLIAESGPLKEKEMEILKGITDNICYSLENISAEFKNSDNEKKLEAALKKYQMVIETAADIIFTTDIYGNFTYVNKAGLNNSGFSKDEILHLNYLDLILPEYRAAMRKYFLKQFASRKPTSYIEYPFRTKSDKIIWYGQNTSLLFEANNITGFHCIARDITERKVVELKLSESESRYRQLVEMSPDAIMVYSRGKILFTNEAGVKLFGADSPDRLINKPVTELFYPGAIDTDKARIKQMMEEGYKFPLTQQKFVRLDGSMLDVEVSAVPITFHNRPAAQAIIRNISGRKFVEEELRRRQREVSTLLDSLPAYAFFKDHKSRYVIVNKSFAALVGIPQDQIAGKTDYDLFPKEQAEKIILEDRLVIETGKAVNPREDRIAEKHNVRTVQIRKVPLLDDSGRTIGLIGLAFDITERKIAEEAVKKYSSELEELNANKDKFFSIISHDLKSPFQGLLGISNALIDEFDRLTLDEIKMFITNIYSSTKNLYNLIENLLQWSRIETGKLEYSPVKLNLYEEVNYSIGLLVMNAKKKDIILRNAVSDNIFVISDMNILASTLQNLISNAIKFTPAGGMITVSAGIEKDKVEVSVTDTGVGIPEGTIKKLFRIESQVSTEGTARESGTGLGLIICKELLEKQGNNIWVTSRIGSGSSFTFTLNHCDEDLN